MRRIGGQEAEDGNCEIELLAVREACGSVKVESVDCMGNNFRLDEAEEEKLGTGSVSVGEVWKDVWAGVELDFDVGGGEGVVVVVEMVSSSWTSRFSLALGNSLASGPLP